MNSSNEVEEEETPTIYRVQNIFEVTCTETPLANNLIKKTIRATTTKLTERRRSNMFERKILIEETPTPLINKKKKQNFHKYSVGKKKSKKTRTPVLRLPPSSSGHSSGSKKIKKLLRKDGRINGENFETNSPTNSQTTPSKKASRIFKPKSKLTDDDENDDDNLGCDLSFDSLKKRERRQNPFVVRLSEVFSNIELDDEEEEQQQANEENSTKRSNLDIDPSPIVLQRSNSGHLGYSNHMESTKITSVIMSPSKVSTTSLTHVTNENDLNMNDTSRFEYTILNENGHVHINEFNQLVILPTQYPINNNNQTEDDDDELTNLTKTKTILGDKTNKLLSITNKKTNENKTQSRYSYCTDISIDEVTIPGEEDDDESNDSSDTSVYSTASSKENLDLNPTTTNKTSCIQSTGSTQTQKITQSPVVLSNKTSSFFKQKTINQTRRSSLSTIETNVVEIEKIVEVNTETTQAKKNKKLLQVNCFLNDDDSLPGSSNPKVKPTSKFSSIFKPKSTTTSNKNKEIVPSESPIEENEASNHNNSIVFNLTQQDLEFIFDSNEPNNNNNNEQIIEQRVISRRSSSKFSSTRSSGGSLVERTTTVTTKAVATTSKAVTTNKQISRKQSRPKKANQVLLSHFDLNSFVDSLNSTFSLTAEKKYNIVFKIGEEIADHVCQLNDKQFYDKTKILCLIKELISKDINFIPSVMNPRLQFITNPVPARIRNNDSTSSSQSDESDTDQANSNEQCNRCLQRNKLLTEVCIRCKLFYHKKCEKIKYIPVNGWICSACKTNNKK